METVIKFVCDSPLLGSLGLQSGSSGRQRIYSPLHDVCLWTAQTAHIPIDWYQAQDNMILLSYCKWVPWSALELGMYSPVNHF